MEQTDTDERAPATEPSRPYGPRAVLALVAAIAAVAAGLWFGVVAGRPALATPREIPLWAFAALFAGCEIFVVHLHFRRETHTLSLNEIPLVLGFFYLPPEALLIAHLAGSTTALVLHRHQTGIKLLFNIALKALEVALGVAIFRALLAGAPATTPRAWIAAVAAAVAIDAVAGAMVTLAIWCSEGSFDRHTAVWVQLSGILFALANASLGLLAFEVVWFEPRAAVLFGSIAATLFVSYRSYAALHERYRSLEQLQHFTRVVGRSLARDDVTVTVLRQACDLLRADRAELVLHTPGERAAVRVAVRTEGPAEHDDPYEIAPDDPVWARVVALGEPVAVPRNSRDPRMRRYLEKRALRDLLAAPLHVDQRIVGFILVADNLGEVGTFTSEDLKLFETLANHASVSLENGRLVGELRRHAAEREYQALHDPLTGLLNRSGFVDRLETAIEEAGRAGTSVGVLLLDLDRFKEVNDTLGHPSGDLLLCEVAERLRRSVREETDTVARLGGDEFGLLLQGIPGPDLALAKATELLAGIALPYQAGDLTLEVDGSFGVAVYPDHGSDASILLQRADVAMYTAKESHTDCMLYSPGRDQNSAERLALAAELRQAISDGDLEVYFQPKVEVASGRLTGAEALVRWQHRVRGFIGPDQFIPVAEHTGLIRPLTMHVLRCALQARQGWAAMGVELGISVNMSVRDLLDSDLDEKVAGLLRATDTPAGALTIEITESQLMDDPERILGVLTCLHDLGLRVSIDDFGTGFSSLASLRLLPVDEIKIDRSFVLGLATDENDEAIVRSTVELGRSLGLHVVAEGVETDVSVERLRRYRCHEMQGYFFSRPLPAAGFVAWMAAWVSRAAGGEDAAIVPLAPRRAEEAG